MYITKGISKSLNCYSYTQCYQFKITNRRNTLLHQCQKHTLYCKECYYILHLLSRCQPQHEPYVRYAVSHWPTLVALRCGREVLSNVAPGCLKRPLNHSPLRKSENLHSLHFFPFLSIAAVFPKQPSLSRIVLKYSLLVNSQASLNAREERIV